MISSKDRSYYFGASDTDMILGNWTSDSFARWWLSKLSIYRKSFDNKYTTAGTYYEHRILESLEIPCMEYDKQIIIDKLRLRVNLDGNTEDTIYEVKTYSLERGYNLPTKHINQVQVQMFATGFRNAKIIAYGLVGADYYNYFNMIDKARLIEITVPYREAWVENVYLPRLQYLAECLIEGKLP